MRKQVDEFRVTAKREKKPKSPMERVRGLTTGGAAWSLTVLLSHQYYGAPLASVTLSLTLVSFVALSLIWGPLVALALKRVFVTLFMSYCI